MTGDGEGNPALWFSPRDELGRAVDEEIMAAAYRVWKRVVSYAESHGQDSSRAAEALEVAAHALAALSERHPHARSRIKSLDYYIFWAAARRLDRAVSREPSIEFLGSADDLAPLLGAQDTAWAGGIERELLLSEIIELMNAQTRRLFSMRRAGYSWDEIARSLGTTAVNVEAYFSKGVAKARRLIMRRSLKGKGDTPSRGRPE
jgi:hypothetical protein